MRRTEQLQGLRLMKFDEVYGRTYRGELSQLEAAEILGMSERTFRRWRDRFEAEGAEGLYDRRLGRVSARRAGVDEVVALLDLFDTRYRISPPGTSGSSWLQSTTTTRSYNWVRLTLQAHGRIAPAPRRRRAPPQAAAPADGRHDVAPGRLHAPMGAGSVLGPDRDHGRCHFGDLFRLLRRRGGHHVELCGAAGGGVGHGAVLLALCRPGLALLAHAGGRRQGRQGQSNPGRTCPAATRY